MDVTSTPQKRATARTAEAASAQNKPDWRELTRTLLQGLSTPLASAYKLAGTDHLGGTTYLLADLKRKVGSMYEMVIDPAIDSRDMLDHLYHLETLFQAACDYRETTDGIRQLFDHPLSELDSFSEVLDVGGESARVQANASQSEPNQKAAAKPAGSTLQKQTAALFVEIGSLADTIRHLSISNHVLEESLETEQVATIMGVRALAGQIGLIADVGAGLHGGHTATIAGADPAFWLLPSSYTEAGGRAA